MPQARFYTVERLGERRGLTPEGFLICYDVPLARTGIQIYAEGEIPVQAGPDGLIRVERPEEEVFREETLLSFNGKPVVVEHPVSPYEGPVDVNNNNWKDFTVGTVVNVRRGDGVFQDVMLGDLIIYDAEAAKLINTGRKRQVSCGYDADYESDQPGFAVQRNIIGNHVALVDNGRCGPLCQVRDSVPQPVVTATIIRGDSHMSFRDSIRDIIMRAAKARSADDLKRIEKEAERVMRDAVPTETPGGNTGEPSHTVEGYSLHVHVHSEPVASYGAGGSATEDNYPDAGGGMEQAILAALNDISAKLDQLLGNGTDSAPMEDGDLLIHEGEGHDNGPEERFEPQPNKKISVAGFGAEAPPGAAGAQNKGSRDSGQLVEAWQEMISQAEIICPGIRLPTFDSRAHPVNTIDAMCRFRRKVLNTVYDTDTELHNVIDSLVDGGYSPSARMTCDAISTVFKAVANYKRERNNAIMARDRSASGTFPVSGPVMVTTTGVSPIQEAERLRQLQGYYREYYANKMGA